jgi:NAD(P)-dependent dehydrogenase (short-subunit alcohol dehydrogenase family)
MKTWFITGTSRGFRGIWAEAALRRGDQVVATARNVAALAPLREAFGERVCCLPLDVTNREAVFGAVRSGHDRFGRLDVVVNNAGFGQFGMVEEVTEAEARRQMDTNFFGALWVTQAVLPILRKQRSGHILQVSSIGGEQAFPELGLYHASKWALEGLTQSLRDEVGGFGIRITLLEPTGYETDWSRASALRSTPMPEYDGAREEIPCIIGPIRARRGKPSATAPVILELVDMADPPFRLFLGDGPLHAIQVEYASRLRTWEKFEALSVKAHGR